MGFDAFSLLQKGPEAAPTQHNFQLLSVALTQPKTLELIDNRKAGENNTPFGRGRGPECHVKHNYPWGRLDYICKSKTNKSVSVSVILGK